MTRVEKNTFNTFRIADGKGIMYSDVTFSLHQSRGNNYRAVVEFNDVEVSRNQLRKAIEWLEASERAMDRRWTPEGILIGPDRGKA